VVWVLRVRVGGGGGEGDIGSAAAPRAHRAGMTAQRELLLYFEACMRDPGWGCLGWGGMWAEREGGGGGVRGYIGSAAVPRARQAGVTAQRELLLYCHILRGDHSRRGGKMRNEYQAAI
jgi:hypothetical protein